MTQITFQDGKPVMRDGKVGTGQGCCCGCNCSMPQQISLTLAGVPDVFVHAPGLFAPAAPCNAGSLMHVLGGNGPTFPVLLSCSPPGGMYPQDATVILDLAVQDPCAAYTYEGYMERPATRQYDGTLDCGGGLSVPVFVSIAKVDGKWLCSVNITFYPCGVFDFPFRGDLTIRHTEVLGDNDPPSDCFTAISPRESTAECPLSLVDKQYAMGLAGVWEGGRVRDYIPNGQCIQGAGSTLPITELQFCPSDREMPPNWVVPQVITGVTCTLAPA